MKIVEASKEKKNKKIELPEEISKLKQQGFQLYAQGGSIYLVSKNNKILAIFNDRTSSLSAIVESNSEEEIETLEKIFSNSMVECDFLFREVPYIEKLKSWYLSHTHLFNPFMSISEWHNSTIFEHELTNLGKREKDAFYKNKILKYAIDYWKYALNFSYNTSIVPTTDLLFKSDLFEIRANGNEFVKMDYLRGIVELYHFHKDAKLSSPITIDAEDSPLIFRQFKISEDGFNKTILKLIEGNFAEIKLQELRSKSDLFSGKLILNKVHR